MEREHAALREYEQRHGAPTAAQAARRAFIQAGGAPPRAGEGPLSASRVMFPHSAPPDRAPGDAAPRYEPLRFQHGGKRYVSPSLAKLGLAGQLGQGRGKAAAAAPAPGRGGPGRGGVTPSPSSRTTSFGHAGGASVSLPPKALRAASPPRFESHDVGGAGSPEMRTRLDGAIPSATSALSGRRGL